MFEQLPFFGYLRGITVYNRFLSNINSTNLSKSQVETCKSFAKAYFANPNSKYDSNIKFSDWNVKILGGNIAWVTNYTNSVSLGSQLESLQIRVQEKINGIWDLLK